MSPKNDNQKPHDADLSVNIDHKDNHAPPATAPPLVNVEATPVPEPVEPTPSLTTGLYDSIEEHRSDRSWPMILFYIALALLVALIVVLAGRFIYHKVHKNQSKSTTTTSSVSGSGTASGSSTSQTSAPATTTPAPTTTTTPANTGQLPNNGPGDVVALFVGVTLAAAGLHYIYQLRRQS